MPVDEALMLSRFSRRDDVEIPDILAMLASAGRTSFDNIMCDINYLRIASYIYVLREIAKR